MLEKQKKCETCSFDIQILPQNHPSINQHGVQEVATERR